MTSTPESCKRTRLSRVPNRWPTCSGPVGRSPVSTRNRPGSSRMAASTAALRWRAAWSEDACPWLADRVLACPAGAGRVLAGTGTSWETGLQPQPAHDTKLARQRRAIGHETATALPRPPPPHASRHHSILEIGEPGQGDIACAGGTGGHHRRDWGDRAAVYVAGRGWRAQDEVVSHHEPHADAGDRKSTRLNS